METNEKNAKAETESPDGQPEVVTGQEVPETDPQKAIPIKSALEQARQDAETAQKEILYVRAEYENYRKRILKEQEQAIKFANKNLVTELLNIVDYFERGIAHSKTLKAKGDAEVGNFVSGIEMTHHEFIQLLTRFGVEFIGKAGEKFDPERHEAVSQKEVAESQVGSVLEVVQKGALLQGRLLKPARVVVGTGTKN